MNVHDPASKNKKWTTALFYFVVFVWMAGASVWSIIATVRWTQAELQLGTYVNLAGKAHASLNFCRGQTHLLKPEGESTNVAGAANGYLYKEFPAYSKWDKLYQDSYNERMRAHLATNSMSVKMPGLKVDLPRVETIEELKAHGHPGDGVESYHTFEHGASKVFVIVTGWGSGAIRDGISIYAYDSLTRFWEPVALWDTKARGVRIEFDKESGVVRVLSKKGETIFTLSVQAFGKEDL